MFAFFAFFVIGLGYFSSTSVNKREHVKANDLAQKIGYNDFSNEAVDFIKKKDQSFYRIDKNYFSSPAMHGSLNDGMVQGYYGTSSYNPFNQKYYIQYLKAMNIVSSANELESRWANGLSSRIILQGLNGVKYVMAKGYTNQAWRASHDSVTAFGDVMVLKHKFALPLGFCYNKVLSFSDFEKLNVAQKDFVSLRAAVVNDSNLADFAAFKRQNISDSIAPASFSWELYKAFTDRQNIKYLKLESPKIPFNQWHNLYFIATRCPPDGNEVYFYLL